MSILKNIWKFIKGNVAKIKAALSQASSIANQIKALTDSPILDSVVKLTETNLDNKALELVRNKLASFIVVMGWAEKVINDFEADPDAKASTLTVISAKTAVLIADANGAKLSIQQALASTPIIYNPKILIESV
jgi:spore coat polysaccharide biosynthesis protein SpsF (cytidylyltransferase family)